MVKRPKNRMITDMKNEQSSKSKQRPTGQIDLTPTKYGEEYVKQVDEYNQAIQVLNPKYANLKPINQVLVRCYLNKPYISPEGVIQPFPVMVNVPTAMGPKATMIENDYNYDFRAVVVACPDNFTQLRQGQTIIIRESTVRPQIVGDIKSGFFQVMPTAFNYPDGVPMVGAKLGDEGFGYILINYQDLVAVIPTNVE